MFGAWGYHLLPLTLRFTFGCCGKRRDCGLIVCGGEASSFSFSNKTGLGVELLLFRFGAARPLYRALLFSNIFQSCYQIKIIIQLMRFRTSNVGSRAKFKGKVSSIWLVESGARVWLLSCHYSHCFVKKGNIRRRLWNHIQLLYSYKLCQASLSSDKEIILIVVQSYQIVLYY